MNIEQISVNTLLIRFADIISHKSLKKVQSFYQKLLNTNDTALFEIVPSYTTILITYDYFVYDFFTLQNKLYELDTLDVDLELENNLIIIDIYYGVEVGLDLAQISKNTQLSIEEIVEIHSNKIYDIYAVGFMPGFGFLGEVDKRIATPRLQTPRKKVAKGSVAIADTQTAVYPNISAGGWNIIGQTTQELFIKNNPIDSISPLKVGGKVKFNPITKKEFLSKGGQT